MNQCDDYHRFCTIIVALLLSILRTLSIILVLTTHVKDHSCNRSVNISLIYAHDFTIYMPGGNSGIGCELVRLLAEKGHVVYLGARNEIAGKEAECV